MENTSCLCIELLALIFTRCTLKYLGAKCHDICNKFFMRLLTHLNCTNWSVSLHIQNYANIKTMDFRKFLSSFAIVWILIDLHQHSVPSMTLLEMVDILRSKAQWEVFKFLGAVLKGDWGFRFLFLFSLSCLLPSQKVSIFAPQHISLCAFAMIAMRSLKQQGQPTMASNLQHVSQNEPFPVISWLSQVFAIVA